MSLDLIAQWLGYTVMIAGGLAIVALLLGLVEQTLWQRCVALHGLNEIWDTMAEQQKVRRRKVPAQ